MKARALALLELRRRGCTVWSFVRISKIRFALPLIIIAGIGWNWTQLPAGSVLAPWLVLFIGLYTGIVLQTVAVFRAISREWAFSYRVTDWQEVEAIANGEIE